MPRKSAAALAVTPMVNTVPSRLAPPDDLDPDATTVWRRLVGSCAPDHFNGADIELLRCYAESAVLAREAFEQMREHGRIVDGKPSPWLQLQEKSVRLGCASAAIAVGPVRSYAGGHDRAAAGQVAALNLRFLRSGAARPWLTRRSPMK